MTNEVDSIFHEEPPRWVQGRAECRVDLKFAALRQIVERDVGDFNGLNDGQRGGRRFNFNSNGEGTELCPKVGDGAIRRRVWLS